MAMGRPTECTPAVIEQLKLILPVVLYIETFANYAGISKVSLYDWMKRGAREKRRIERGAEPLASEAICVEFLNAYKRSVAEGELYSATVIKKAAQAQWQAAAWILERRFPERWGRDRLALAELEKRVSNVEGGLRQPAAEEDPPARKGPTGEVDRPDPPAIVG